MGEARIRRGGGISLLNQSEGDLGQALALAATRHGDRPYLRSLDTGEALTYHDLNAGAARVANLLHTLGLRPGSRVAVRLPALPDAACVLFGAMRMGMVAVVSGGSRPVGLATLAGLARVAFAAGEDSFAGLPPGCRHLIRMGPGNMAGRVLDGPALLAEASVEPVAEVREASPGAAANALAGVGGEGQVTLTHGDILAAARRLIERYRFRAEEACVGLLPLDCCPGFVAMGLVNLITGGTIWWGTATRPPFQPSVPWGWAIGRPEAFAALARSFRAPRPAFRVVLYPADSGRPGTSMRRLGLRVEAFDDAGPAGGPAVPLQVV